MHGREAVVHVRIRYRGTPGQDRRSDFGRGSGRDHDERPERKGRVRNAGDDRTRPCCRRDHDRGVRGHPYDRARSNKAHWVYRRQLRFRLPHLFRDHIDML